MSALLSENSSITPRRLIITVHGIRTFGSWQDRLERTVIERVGKNNIMFANYRYGFFSVVLFIIPFMRWLAVKRFQRELSSLTSREKWSRIDLVGHSFGTHLLVWALRRLPKGKRPTIHTVLLAGSVLKSRFRWSDLDGDVRRVVNDCGIVDTVLLCDQLLVFGTGMAGRVGFVGATHGAFRDRFHLFGHSGYFVYANGKLKDRWMVKYWLPALLHEGEIAPHDERRALSPIQGILFTAALYMEPIKLALLITPIVAISLYVAGLYVKADRERLIAEAQSSRSKSLLLSSQSRGLLGVNDERALLLAVEASQATAKQGYVTSTAQSILQGALGRVTGVALNGHPHSIRVTEFSTDERLLATASEDPSRNYQHEVRIWNISNPKVPTLLHIVQSRQSTRSIVFDQAGAHVVALQTFDDGQEQAVVWPLTKGKRYLGAEARPLFPRPRNLASIAQSTDAEVLAVASSSGDVSLVSLANLSQTKILRELKSPFPDRVTRLGFAQDNRVLLACTHSSHVWIWDLESTSAAPIADIDAKHRADRPVSPEVPIDICGISDDHTILYTGSSNWFDNSTWADLNLKLWRLEKLSPIGAPLLLSHRGATNSSAIQAAALARDGTTLTTMSLDGWVRSWHISKANEVLEGRPVGEYKLQRFVDHVEFGPDRSLVAFAAGNEVRLLRVGALAQSGNAPVAFALPGFNGGVAAVHFSRTGRYLFAAGRGGVGRLWDLMHDDPVAPVPTPAPSPYEPARTAILLNGGTAAVALRNSAVEFWTLHNPYHPKLMLNRPLDSSQVAKIKDCLACTVLISPDLAWAAIQGGHADETDVIELKEDGRAFKVQSRTWSATGEIEFSYDSQWLFVREGNKQAIFKMSAVAPELPRRMEMEIPNGSYTRVASKVGKWVLYDKYVNKYREPIGRGKKVGFLWSLSGKTDSDARVDIDGFAYGIGRAAYSPDGRWLALAGEYDHPDRSGDDTVVRVVRLDAPRSAPIELTGHEFAPELSFSGDGRWLLTASHDILLDDRRTLARLWRLDAGQGSLQPYVLPGVTTYLHGSKFSQDGRFLVTISGGGPTARLWRLEESKVALVASLAIPRQIYNWHWNIAFDATSSIVVIANRDNPTPYLWRLDKPSVSQVGVPIGNGDSTVESLEFIDNDRKLMIRNSSSSGSHVTIVNLETFPADGSVNNVGGTPEPLKAAAYRGDFGLLLTNGDALRAHIISVPQMIERAKFVLGRNMSLEEWAQTEIRDIYRPTFLDLPIDGRTLRSLVGVAALIRQSDQAAAAELAKNIVTWTVKLNEADVCNLVSWEFALQSDGANALQAVACALNHRPENPNYRDTRGAALALLGRKEEALADLRFSIAAFASDADFVTKRRRWIEALESGRDPFPNGLD